MTDKKISALTSATTPLGGTEIVPIVQNSITKKVAISDLTAGRSLAMALLDVDNVRIDGNSITATNTNGNLDLNADGTGLVTTNKGMYIKGDIEFTNGGTASLGKLWNDIGWTSLRADYTNVYGLKLDAYSAIRVDINNAEIARFGSTGLAFTSGKGIDFSATAGTGTSELLDDYEEGTWTPTDGSGAGLAITSADCVYTKVGRSVTLCGQVTIPANASGLAAAITGLPFTSPYQYIPGNNLNPTSYSANIAIATDRLVFYTSPYTVQSANTSVVGTHYIQITYQV